MDELKNKRDYKKETQRDKELNKRYFVRIPIYQAKELDKKLAEQGKTFSKFMRECIEKYLKK